ncbi:MAG: hypothetical protein WD895_07830 [Acidimicrobiia bacterium]
MTDMWCDWSTMGFFGMTMMILLWGAIVALVIRAIRSSNTTRDRYESDALSILERHLATGEIDREQFEERKRLLDRS